MYSILNCCGTGLKRILQTRITVGFSKLFADLSLAFKLVPQLEDLCLQITVHAALYSPQFLLKHQANLDGCQHSLSVKELYKKVHWQLAMSRGSAIEAMVPALNVVVGAYGMSEHCPVCGVPGCSMNPRAGNILSELQKGLRSFLLKSLEH